MSTDIERVMLKLLPERELAKISLQEGKMYLLLREELKQSDIETLRKSLDDTDSSLQKLDSAYGGAGIKLGTIPGVGEYAQKLGAAVTRARGVIAKLDLEDPQWHQLIRKHFGQEADAEGIARAVTAIQAKANEFHGGVTSAISKVVKNLEPMLKDNPESLEKPIKDIAGIGGIPPLEELEKGLDIVLKKGAPKSGIMAKAASFFSGLFKKGDKILDEITGDLPDELDLGAMRDYILSQPLSSLKKAAKAGGIPGGRTAPPPPTSSIVADVTSPEPEQEEPGADDAPGGDVAPPIDDADAERQQDQADDSLGDAIDDETEDVTSPMDAAMDAISGWHEGLPPFGQAALMDQNRLVGLQDKVRGSLESAADVVHNHVADAVSSWRTEHEEALIDSDAFDEGTFDSLEKLIPQLAAGMMKQVSESRHYLRRDVIKRSVYKYLNKRYQKGWLSTDVLLESSKQKSIRDRWQYMAGIVKN